jgi:hypothetical protein
MNKHASKGIWDGKSWLKIAIMTLCVLIVGFGFWVINTLFGNPIRKHMAKSNCLDYYQDQYHELFIVHEIDYSSKLPGYVLTLSPESNPHIQFTCNPNCDTLCYSDEYGGVLASRLLVEEIHQILEPQYGDLAILITAAEDPFTEYGGENPDYFETDPRIRLTKNHQNLSITWVDPSLSKDDFEHIAEDIAAKIEAQLPFINPNLDINITVYPDDSIQIGRFSAKSIHFPTMSIEE